MASDFVPIGDTYLQIIRRLYGTGRAGQGVYGEVRYQSMPNSTDWTKLPDHESVTS